MVDIINKNDVLENLKKQRNHIDEIDGKIAGLLNDRFDCCKEIAKLKQYLGLSLVNLERQDEVLANINRFSKDEFAEINKSIFSKIMCLSLSLQQRFQTKNKHS